MNQETRRFRLFVVLASLVGAFGTVYVSCGEDTPSTTKPACGECPDGLLCDTNAGACVVFCLLPQAACPADYTCDVNAKQCVKASEGEGEGEGTEGEGEGTEGEGEGEGTEGEGEGEGECGNGTCDGSENPAICPSDCSCPNGLCDNGETLDSCPADCSTTLTPVCGPQELCPAIECGSGVCHARQRCVGDTCVPWDCGETCHNSSQCVQGAGGAWACQPVDCEEDEFRAANSESRTPSRITARAYPLSFCASAEDWFSLEVPANAGLIVRLSFGLEDVDLDLQLYKEGVDQPVAQQIRQLSGELMTYTVPEGQGGNYLIRVYQVLPQGAPLVPMYYSLEPTILRDTLACEQTASCPQGQVCNLAMYACQEKDCRVGGNWTCTPLETCNEETGACEAGACVEDAFAGNATPETAVSIDFDHVYGLSICDPGQGQPATPDWFKFDAPAGKCIHAQVNFQIPDNDATFDIDEALYGPNDPTALLVQPMLRLRNNENIYWTTTVAGTYYLVARQARQNVYELQVELGDGPCNVACDVQAAPDTCLELGMHCSENEPHVCVPFGQP